MLELVDTELTKFVLSPITVKIRVRLLIAGNYQASHMLKDFKNRTTMIQNTTEHTLTTQTKVNINHSKLKSNRKSN